MLITLDSDMTITNVPVIRVGGWLEIRRQLVVTANLLANIGEVVGSERVYSLLPIYRKNRLLPGGRFHKSKQRHHRMAKRVRCPGDGDTLTAEGQLDALYLVRRQVQPTEAEVA